MALPSNAFQQVITYQRSNLAFLLNLCCLISTSNTKFREFEKLEANLGDTVGFDKPPRYDVNNSLVANFQGSTQNVQNLTVNQAFNTSFAFSAQQFMFNAQQYMDMFGKAATYVVGNKAEEIVGNNFISNVRDARPGSATFGLPDSSSGPFRFFGDGIAAINSYGQLAQALANYRDFGAPTDDTKVYLPSVDVPAIVNSGLNQFATARNNETAKTWWLGDFARAAFYESNLLPTHFAGNVGNAGTELTVVSTNDPTGANITQITLSGATALDADAVKYGDLGQFVDNVGSFVNLRFTNWIGSHVTRQPVQIRVTENEGATGGGQVTLKIYPALSINAPTSTQVARINTNIVAGMKLKLLPDHKAGAIVGGKGMFVAMPMLPEEIPFPTANKADTETGISIRHYYGSLFGQNQRGYVNDFIMGTTLVPENSMRLIFPA